MYNNVSKKIQKLGQIIGIGLMVAGVIAFLILISLAGKNSRTLYTTWAFVSLGIGVVGWISSWFMYAFGQLVDDVRAIRGKLEA